MKKSLLTDAERHELIQRLAAENEQLRAVIEDAVDTLESMDLHVGNPLYDRLRKSIDADWR